MKLARISKPLRSVQVRISLAGDLNAQLERYAILLRARSRRVRGLKDSHPGNPSRLSRGRPRVPDVVAFRYCEQSFHRRCWRLIERHSQGASVMRMARRSVDVLRTWNPLTRHSSLDEGR